MGLDLPDLDDRTHEDLLEQAKKLIPAYSENWTDFNPHDPGITILELLAWLTETHTYQVDQITDEHREKYLQLIGYRPRPPRSATATLQVSPSADAAGSRLPAQTALTATDGQQSPVAFETDEDVVLTAATVAAVHTVVRGERRDHTEANETAELVYRPFGTSVQPGNALYLRFDGDPFANTDALTLWASYHEDVHPEPAGGDPTGGVGPSVELTWEYRDPETAKWSSLQVERDGTNSFYESGLLELVRDGTVAAQRDAPGWVDTGDPWIRCRVESGRYELPPLLENVRTNVVTASHAVTVTDEELEAVDGGGSGTPRALDGQTYAFANRPVHSATVSVDGAQFTEVPDFDASGPDDPHYVLDGEAGRVTFGDGKAGRVPEAEATVTATYTYGGGDRGNVSTNASWRVDESRCPLPGDVSAADVEVTPLGAASGGADAESIDDALRRARRDLRRPQRAVTESDYRTIAEATPGFRIGRTSVWTDDGKTSLVVVPYAPRDVPSPTPSEAFLEAVRSHVTARTLLTDHVHVSGPQYVRLDVTVVGAVRPQYAGSGYESAVREAIESYLHPLYGYDGDGWPFGRSLTHDEVIAEIERVDAVDHVSELSITAHGGTAFDDGTVAIDETALFALEDVTIDMTRPVTGGGRR